jgi:hypothetical protein
MSSGAGEQSAKLSIVIARFNQAKAIPQVLDLAT